MTFDFVRQPPSDQLPIDAKPFDRWLSTEGEECSLFFRDGGNFRLRFNDLADFTIDLGRRLVTGTPTKGLPEEVLEHLYRNQVVPLVMGHDGELVLHASAVGIGRQAVAFLGSSGRGKSTLAASFSASGNPFLSDDGLILDQRDGAYFVCPRYPGLRLCSDSAAEILGAPSSPSSLVTAKTYIPADASLQHSDETLPLAAIYILVPPQGVDAPQIHSLSRAAAVAQMLQHSFILDSEDADRIEHLFDQLVDLSAHVACLSLDYPRNFTSLPAVLEAVRDHLEEVQQ